MKHLSILTILLALTITMNGCSSIGLNTSGNSTVSDSTSQQSTVTDEDEDNDEELDATVAKTITENGTHTITGIVNGQILVTAENVTLILDGATINCSDGSAILGKDGNGTEILQNLTVELQGENSITSSKHGIQGKDNLTVTGTGSAAISSGKDGLHAGDTLTVENGTFNITATGDGIDVGNSTDGTGELILNDGNFNIIAGGGSSVNTSSVVSGGKGIKSAKDITITGGTFNIDSVDDSIHANGNISVSQGIFTISSGDDGIHADGDLKISGGEITVLKSYEALEGNNIYISDGIMDLISSDDGINAAGGSSNGTDGGFGPFGGDRFRGGGDNTIDISGGTVKFYAGGDGLDSNGTINISNGTVIAIINSTPDNSALDSDGETTVTGGTVIAGGTGTFESISSNSTQSYVYLTNISANSDITVKSAEQTLASYIADKDMTYLTIFAPGIESGNSYDVTIGGISNTVTAGVGGGWNMGGGMGRPDGMGGGMGKPGEMGDPSERFGDRQ